MDQVAGKKRKNPDDSPIECKQPTLPHLPCPGEEAGGLDSPTSPTTDSDTSETSSISSSESYYRPYDSPELYRKFESAVIEYVTINPGRGSAKYDRLEGEMYASSEPSYIRRYLMNHLLSNPLDYTDVSLDGGTWWNSALHSAAHLGLAVICEILLSSGKCLDVNRRNHYHKTPLMDACVGSILTHTETEFCDRAGVVRHLISHRADLHAKDSEGCTALQFALEGGHHDCAKILLQAGCSISDLKDAERSGLIEKMIQDQPECLTQSYEELKKVMCPTCPMWEHHSAADVFPVTKTGAAVADSRGGRTVDATITETPRVLSGDEEKTRHTDIVIYLSEALTGPQTGTLVTAMVLQTILPANMGSERDMNNILLKLCERGFIAPGKYAKLFKFLVKRSMIEVAQNLKGRAESHFGPLDWE